MVSENKKTKLDKIEKWILGQEFEESKILLFLSKYCKEDSADYNDVLQFVRSQLKNADKNKRDKLLAVARVAEQKKKELDKANAHKEKQQREDGSENSEKAESLPHEVILENGPTEVTNDEQNNGPKPADDARDYEEPDNENLPPVVRRIKGAFDDWKIPCRAINKDQQAFPFSYNLYVKDTQPNEDNKPTGRLTIESENKAVLASDDLNHFIATMNGIRAAGGTLIDLNPVHGSEEARKRFAANAVVAGMLTGVKIGKCPYPLEELAQVNNMVTYVINLRNKQEEIRKDSENLNSPEAKEQLKQKMSKAFNEYQQVSEKYLPPKEQMRVFECGIEAVKKEQVREIARKVLQEARTAAK